MEARDGNETQGGYGRRDPRSGAWGWSCHAEPGVRQGPQTAAVKEPVAIVPLAAGLGPSPQPKAAPIGDDADLPAAALQPVPPAPEPAQVEEATLTCTITLDLAAREKATLDVTLLAPCRPNERVVLRHGGLAITAKTSATGSVFLQLPGMEANGIVSALFNDGVEPEAQIDLPDMALYQRFAVQWLADDAFQLHAFENGADYGQPGHVSAETPALQATAVPARGGYLTQLGSRDVALPMLAEVYTYPTDPKSMIALTVESEVTRATCNRELLGEILESRGGTLSATDLTMAMPDCDAVGDVLVLNNPESALTLAAAN